MGMSYFKYSLVDGYLTFLAIMSINKLGVTIYILFSGACTRGGISAWHPNSNILRISPFSKMSVSFYKDTTKI